MVVVEEWHRKVTRLYLSECKLTRIGGRTVQRRVQGSHCHYDDPTTTANALMSACQKQRDIPRGLLLLLRRPFSNLTQTCHQSSQLQLCLDTFKDAHMCLADFLSHLIVSASSKKYIVHTHMHMHAYLNKL
jgi:hypothetical protein